MAKIFLLIVAILIFPAMFYIAITNKDDKKTLGDGMVCRGGLVFDRYSNRQLIGVNGGGIPCVEFNMQPKGQ